MAVEGADFSVSTREKKKGKIFYVQFKLPNGKFGNAKSTGIIDQGRKKDRQAAIAWAQNYLNTGAVIQKERVTFGQYSEGFFDWDGKFCQTKIMKGRRFSRQQADQLAGLVRTHLNDFFGDVRLQEIDDLMIEAFQRGMKQKGFAGSTINKATIALRFIMKEAAREKLVRALPLMESVAVEKPTKGVYTPDEIRTIFNHPWKDFRHYVANLVGAITGCRAGEISALKFSHVHPEYMEIKHTWSPQYGLGKTKTGKERIVPIPARVYEKMQELMAQNPHKNTADPFVFYSFTPEAPIDQSYFTKALYRVLEEIGIDVEERRRRGLNFHAWRHTFNSLLVAHRVPIPMVQSVTGHLTTEMTQHYYHLTDEARRDIRALQEGII